jgi:hypothetical protein
LTLLLTKLALAPLLVVASSLAGRRWGAQLAGLLAALPLVAGPILLFTELSHGERFASRAASASLLGLVALVAFAIGFAWAARRCGWLGALLLGWIAYGLVGALDGMVLVDALPSPSLRFVAASGAFLLGLRLLPRWPEAAAQAPTRPPAWDLPARAAATAALVVIVTGVSSLVGPTFTGIAAPFPVATSILGAFTLAAYGAPQATELLGGFLRGGLGFAAFCLIVALLDVPSGAPIAFALAACGALLGQAAALLLARAGTRSGVPGRLSARCGFRRDISDA